MKQSQLDTLKFVADTLPRDNIVLRTIEEGAEFDKVLIKNINSGKNNRDDIVEEMAHKIVMLKLLEYKYNISESEINSEIEERVQRELHRANKWKTEYADKVTRRKK